MLSVEIISALIKLLYWTNPGLNHLFNLIVGALAGMESSHLSGSWVLDRMLTFVVPNFWPTSLYGCHQEKSHGIIYKDQLQKNNWAMTFQTDLTLLKIGKWKQYNNLNTHKTFAFKNVKCIVAYLSRKFVFQR